MQPLTLSNLYRTCLQLLALPSKRQGLFAPVEGTLIARSDTNGEDLEGYAGAGLYDRYGCTLFLCAPLALLELPASFTGWPCNCVSMAVSQPMHQTPGVSQA